MYAYNNVHICGDANAYYVTKYVTEMSIDDWLLCALPISFRHVIIHDGMRSTNKHHFILSNLIFAYTQHTLSN